MSDPYLTNPEFVMHAFTWIGDAQAGARYQALRQTWDAVRYGLDLHAPVRRLGAGMELPERMEDVPDGAVAVCERAEDTHPVVNQAMFRRLDSDLILSVALAPPDASDDASDDAWRNLDRRWEQAAAGLGGTTYGVTRIYQGVLARRSKIRVGDVPGIADALTHLVPTGGSGGIHQRSGSVTRDGFAVWDTGPPDHESMDRRLVVLAGSATRDPHHVASLLSNWTWYAGEASPTPLIRYLLNDAKLRHHCRLWRASQQEYMRLRGKIANSAEAIVAQLRGWSADPLPDSISVSRLLETCYQIEAELAGLVDTTSKLRMMRHSVKITIHNRLAAIPGERSSSTAVFSEDLEHGRQLVDQLDDDSTYLAETRTAARDVVATARDALQRRAIDLEQEHRRRQEKFLLLQTAIIGSILLCLTTIQSLNYRVPLHGGTHAAVIAALGAVGLWFALVVLRLAVSVPGRAAEPKSLRFVELFVGGMTGAFLFWAASSWLRLQLHHDPVSALFTFTWSFIGFGLGVIVANCASWGRSR